MNYKVNIPKKVAKQIKALPSKIRDKVLEKLTLLEDNPRPPNVKKLKGYDTIYRFRVEDYRVLYEIEDSKLIILVLKCGHRRDAYKKII